MGPLLSPSAAPRMGSIEGLGWRRIGAEAGALDRLGYIDIAFERGDGRRCRRVGQEDGGEEGIGHSGKIERAVECLAGDDLLRVEVVKVPIAVIVELGAVVGGAALDLVLVAEASRPAEQRCERERRRA